MARQYYGDDEALEVPHTDYSRILLRVADSPAPARPQPAPCMDSLNHYSCCIGSDECKRVREACIFGKWPAARPVPPDAYAEGYALCGECSHPYYKGTSRNDYCSEACRYEGMMRRRRRRKVGVNV